MKRTKLCIVLITLFLSACGGDVTKTAVAELPANTIEPTATDTAVPIDTPTPEPTETAVPTDTPTPIPTETPEPTAIPDPLAGYTDFESAENQITFQHPKEWMIIDEPDSRGLVILNNIRLLTDEDFDEGTMAFVIIEQVGFEDPAPEEYVEDFVVELSGEDGIIYDLNPIGELEIFEVNDQPAGYIEYDAIKTNNDEQTIFFASIIFGDEHTAFIFGVSSPKVHEEESKEILANILNSIQLNAGIETVDLDSIYAVSSYDPSRDPQEDVADALKVAEAEGKRVLLIVGGDWCITCHVLEKYIVDTKEITRRLTDSFVIVKVNFSEENENEVFLADYPEIEWFPHFYILESDGTLTESYDTRQLETSGFYDYEKFVEFLDQWSAEEVESKADSFYVVKEYDPERDPFADVETAVSQAQAENKNLLLIIGGDWCIWCTFLENFIATNEEVHQAIADNYLVLKINFSAENENEEFFAQYPEVPSYPHLFVLDQDGEFLRSQGTLALEVPDTDTYDPERFIAFLQEWAP